MRLQGAALLLLPPLVACGTENGPLMEPGENCLACHGSIAVEWTAAGTVYGSVEAEAEEGLEGVTVEIVDSLGESVTLTTNAVGNFYTAEALVAPFDAAIEKDGVRFAADEPRESGACNSCHYLPPTDDAQGRLHWATD